MFRSSFSLLVFSFSLIITAPVYSQETNPTGCNIYIDIPECPANPVEKPGYYLLLNPSFQNPSKYWNVSKPYDDAGCAFHFISNQDNVTFPCLKSDGTASSGTFFDPSLQNREDTCYAYIWNTNVPSDSCLYSKGEIKTMTVDISNDTFTSYYFYGPGYVEAKIRQLFCTPGQGSAMWMWSVIDSDDTITSRPGIYDDMEIDVFETHPDDSGSFNLGYHWRMSDGLKKVSNYYQIHINPYDYTDWTVYGVHWSKNRITWYVNNKEVIHMDMEDKPAGCTSGNPTSFYPPEGPFCLRFGTGANSVGEHEPVIPETLPTHLEIEYVRVYKPEGEKAAPIRVFAGIPNHISVAENSFENTNTILIANYYPDATYSWSSPAFEIAPYEMTGHLPQHHSGKVKIWVKPGVQGNKSYPVVLSTNLYSHSEQDTAWYYICTEAPPLPSDNFQASQINPSLCYYEISHPVDNPSTAGCEFFDEVSQSWKEASIRTIGNNRYAYYGRFEPLSFVPIQYREKNACGYSEIRYTGITMPVPPPGTCGW